MALEKIILKKGSSTAETYTKGAIDTLLSGKQPSGNYQPAGNYATLGSDGKIPSSQLPSYVDDVLEYASKSAFPATGEAGKIYIAKDTNKTYRWSGSAYVEISASLALGETSSTAYAGNKGKANADAIAALQTGKANKATTLSGYGITDAYTKTEVDTKVNAKATKATTLSGYGITDAYTKSQVDTYISNATFGMVPTSKVMATYTANYAISDGEIDIFLKNNNGTASKQLQITPTSISWDNQNIATVNQIPDVSNKADKATTLAGYGITNAYTKSEIEAGYVPNDAPISAGRAKYVLTSEGINIYVEPNDQDQFSMLKITPQNIYWGKSSLATLSDVNPKADKATTLAGYGITDAYTKTETNNLLSNKAAHTSVATSSDGKTITFTFD